MHRIAAGGLIGLRHAANDPFLPLKHKSPDVRFAALSGLGERLTVKERHPQESANQYLLGLILAQWPLPANTVEKLRYSETTKLH